jgi:hypothetical protein
MWVGVKTTWQVAEPPVPVSVQVLEESVLVPPAPLGVAIQVTVPVGVTVVPKLVSVTVTRQ